MVRDQAEAEHICICFAFCLEVTYLSARPLAAVQGGVCCRVVTLPEDKPCA